MLQFLPSVQEKERRFVEIRRRHAELLLRAGSSSQRKQYRKTDKAKTKEVSRKVKDRDSLLESNCCMCGKQIMEEDEYHQLPVCLHNYHPKCLDRLMEDGNTSCILCNNNLRVATIKKIYGIDMQDDQ